MTKEHGSLIAALPYIHDKDFLKSEQVEKMDRRMVARMMLGKSMTTTECWRQRSR